MKECSPVSETTNKNKSEKRTKEDKTEINLNLSDNNIGDKLTNEKESDKEKLKRFQEENQRLQEENKRLQEENKRLQEEINQLKEEKKTRENFINVFMGRLDLIEKRNELLQKKVDKLDMFLRIYPQYRSIFDEGESH